MSISVREKKLKSGKKSLYLDIYHNGQRHYEFLRMYITGDRKADKETRQLAESVKAKRQLEIQHSAHGFTPAFKKQANFVDYFRKVTNSFDTDTKGLYENVLKKIKSYKGNQVPFATIDKRWVEGFKSHLLETIQQSTARTYFTVLKAVLNRAVADEIIQTNPANKVDNFKNGKKLIGYLTIPELKALKNTPCDETDLKEAFLFSCYTGLRFSDVKKLTWDQIRDGKIEFRQKKTTNAEYLDLNGQAIGILTQMDKTTQNVFRLKHNVNVNIELKKWAAKAELKRWIKTDTQKGLTYHVSRHTFAVQLLSNGVDVFTLKELLGHKSIDSTMMYAQIVNKTKKAGVNKFPEL